jgi:hypothetical protein
MGEKNADGPFSGNRKASADGGPCSDGIHVAVAFGVPLNGLTATF